LKSDLKFLTDLKNSGDTWTNIYFPEQRLDALETRYTDNLGKVNVPQAVKELLGSINDPVVRHRLGVFSDRLTKLQSGDDKEGIPACGVPETVVLEFVREDFMGERAKRDLQKFMSDREKARKEAGERAAALGVHEKSGRLKFELFKSQGGTCLYCQQNFKETDLANYRIEHIVPRAQGGPDAMVNYVLAHEACNDAKGDKTPFEWKHDQQGWDGYKSCVEKHGTLLRNKKVQLLLREDAAELVERYTALAETAWITKLAQKIVSLHFGWPRGVDREGKRRVIAVSGGLTARIRRKYRLNSLLNPPPAGTTDLIEWEAKAEKNRNDKRHHALDAMVINFLPQWMRDEKKGWFFRFPEPVRKNPRGTFEKEIADVMPRLLAFEKAPLAETIYGGRVDKGKTTIVQRVPLRKLAFNTVKQREVFDRKYLAGQIKSIRDPLIADMLRRFLEKESNGELAWNAFCEKLCLQKRDGTKGSRVLKVNVTVGAGDEYAEMSKDGKGAYHKGKKGHKGQIIYLERFTDKKGIVKEVAKVLPVYAFQSRNKAEAKLRKDLGDALVKIYGFYQTGCLVSVTKEVANQNNPLPAGLYSLNSIRADGMVKITNKRGQTYPDLPFYSLKNLIAAGLSRAD
jgi:CRISPR-associated endonuclease Csn1